MIAVDTNVLVYAHRAESGFHARAFDCIQLLAEGNRPWAITVSWPILSDLTHKAKLQGGQFHDARIAALCIENGVSALYSADRDFGRFIALKTINPLVD